MKARTIFLAATTSVVLFTLAGPTAGQSGSFVITNADATAYVDVAASSDLNPLISSVAPRFVVQYANAMRSYNMTPVSSELQSLLAQVGDKITVQYANANRNLIFVYPVGLA